MRAVALAPVVLALACSPNTEPAYRIPVVVHVVHNGEPVGEGANLSLAQIQSQIDVLNEDFGRMAGTNGFNDHPDGASTGITFYLAETGPNGEVLEEPGVDRVNGGRATWPKGPIRNPIDIELKPQTSWDPSAYFNIWTVNFGGFVSRDLLGYAQFPSGSGLEGLNEDGGPSETDGIVVGHQYFGSSEKGNFEALTAPYDLGRTTTHEVGHYLGLRHIWGDGDCSVDDYCADTPVAAGPNFECGATVTSCGSVDMVENYMDYTADACMNVFTADQRDRMHTVLENSPNRPGRAL
jgi:hypothetical protein